MSDKIAKDSVCGLCGNRVKSIDAGFSPAVQKMTCPCGGSYVEEAR